MRHAIDNLEEPSFDPGSTLTTTRVTEISRKVGISQATCGLLTAQSDLFEWEMS